MSFVITKYKIYVPVRAYNIFREKARSGATANRIEMGTFNCNGDASITVSAGKYGNAITVNNLYIALFTHVFGYSEFVSWIFKIFGENLYVVAIANVDAVLNHLLSSLS